MGLFSKPKVPGIDVGALTRLAEQNAATQRDIVGKRKMALEPLRAKFGTDRAALSAQIEPGTENLLNRYASDIQGVGATERAANQNAIIGQRERSFREVPELQRAIRASLGGSGLLRSGAAASQIANPILEAARSSRDFSTDLETSQLAREGQRAEGLATNGFNARTDALNKRLGIDEGTLNELASMGREDLLAEYADIAGIEDQLGANRLGIEQARQQNEMAKAAAANARRSGIISSLGSLAGTAIGSFGGPLGASIGSQVGGMVGNFAGGGTGGGTFDPTLLYALSQQNRRNVSRSLGGGRSTPTVSNYSSVVGY